MTLDIGTLAPDFSLRSHTLGKVTRDDLIGQKSLIVFVPYPFTRVCTAELCKIRDTMATLNDAGARVVVITAHATSTNAEWVRQNQFNFDVLADFWPHGEISRRYDAFDERFGYSTRVTYFLDGDAVVRDVISSEALGEARDFDRYETVVANY